MLLGGSPWSLPKITVGQNQLVSLWPVVDQCNLACPLYAFDRRLTFPRRLSDPDEVARMIDALAAWQDQTGRPVVLSWLGGDEMCAASAIGDALRTKGQKALRNRLLRSSKL